MKVDCVEQRQMTVKFEQPRSRHPSPVRKRPTLAGCKCDLESPYGSASSSRYTNDHVEWAEQMLMKNVATLHTSEQARKPRMCLCKLNYLCLRASCRPVHAGAIQEQPRA